MGLLDDVDWEEYLRRYQDVANAGMDPRAHYTQHGQNEGRELSYLPSQTGGGAPNTTPSYAQGNVQQLDPDALDYLRRYQDVANDPYWGLRPAEHYAMSVRDRSGDRTWGIPSTPTGGLSPNENRPSYLPSDWNWQQYVANYEDLRNAGIDTAEEAASHYQSHGRNENRSWGTPGQGLMGNMGVVPVPPPQNPTGGMGAPVGTGGFEPGIGGGDPYQAPGGQQVFGYTRPVAQYASGVDPTKLEANQVDKYWKAPEGWDPKKYLAQNPDLENDPWAKANPLAHYALYGMKEGRQYGTGGYANTNFKNARGIYLSQNKDVLELGMDPWEHYQKHGKAEGRKWPGDEWDEEKTYLLYTDKDFKAPEDWNAKYYLRDNPDLKDNAWAQANPLAHMALFGQKEGRTYYNTDDLSKLYGPKQKAIMPAGGVGGVDEFLTTAGTNFSNWENAASQVSANGLEENPYSLAPQTETGTLLAHNEGMYNPIDEEGNLKSAKQAERGSIREDNVAAIVSLGGGSHRVYFNDGTFSDLTPGLLERGYIGRTRVTENGDDFYRYFKRDGTTVDTPLENKPSGLSRFTSNVGEWLHSAMPVIIPAAGLAAITAGAGGVIGAAYGGATGASGGAAAGGSMSTGVGEGLMSGAMGSATAGGSAAGAGAGAATGTATGGATGTATGASTTPWYLSQPMVQSYTTAGLQTGVGMMQGKSFGEAVTQGVISGALSYAGGYIVDGMGNSIGAVANNPAASKAIVTGLLSTASSKIQGAEWEEALLNGLTTGTLSYVGGKISGWLTSPSGEEVNAEELFSSKGPPPAEYTRQQLPPSSSSFTGMGENLEFGGTPAPPWQPQGFGGYGGESLGNYGFPSTPGLSAGELTQGLSYGSPLSVPGYESPFMNNRYFNPIDPRTGEYYENPNEFKFPGLETYYNSQNPWNMNNALTEGLTYANPTLEWINPIERFGGEDPFGNMAFINSLTYGKPNLFNSPYKSPLEGTMFGPGGGLLNYGYPGTQNPGPGVSIGGGTTSGKTPTMGQIIKSLLPLITGGGGGGAGGGGGKGGGGGEGSAKGGLLSLDEMPIPEYLKRKLKKKAKAAGKSWREYLADATQGQKSYYSHLA